MTSPGDPLTSLEEGAASLHELFVSYVRAGFTKPEALYLVAAFLSASLGPPRPPAP